jgi:N utilization substance protein B
MKNEMNNNKPGQFANRTLARTVVFQLLFLEDVNPDNPQEWTSEFLSEKLPDHEEILKFARQLKAGVQENQQELDEKIEQVSKNWSLARMSVSDRNILRLALYEMLYVQTPKPVIINEAIELAKKFGSAESPGFVNGILDQFDAEGATDRS